MVNEDNESFSWVSPRYAFPTVYPPQDMEDPFPCRFGINSFPVPQWERTRATKKARKHNEVSLEQLSALFGRLSLSDHADVQEIDTTKDNTCTRSRCCENISAARNPFVVQTYPAPLPCLVRRRHARHYRYHDCSASRRARAAELTKSGPKLANREEQSLQLLHQAPINNCLSPGMTSCMKRKIPHLPRRRPSCYDPRRVPVNTSLQRITQSHFLPQVEVFL